MRPPGRTTEQPLRAPARPAVPPKVYDADYYLHRCAGAAQWASSDGTQFDPLYQGSLELAQLRPGDVLVDLGTGRAELIAVAIARGAALAVGVEYSPDALALARRTLDRHDLGGRGAVVAADARCLPLPEHFADLVTMLDIVEHLSPEELHATLLEARRVLRPSGRLFAHTLPNRRIYDVTYRWQRRARPSRWRQWPADPRGELERLMHVNEQSRRSLRRALCLAGFSDIRVDLGTSVYDDFVPDRRARRLYSHLARRPLTATFGVADIWAEARSPGPARPRHRGGTARARR
ncbi:MAG: class I SAM-dependent methyltransferase [Actinomycetota bacterium]|nr:class I SAM-dependent methyltransferase [Actinomycetota bacterium]